MSARVHILAAAIVLTVVPGLARPRVVTAQGADPETQALRERADTGDPIAEYMIGVAYDNGRGVPRDFVQAAAWYRRAADHGEAKAQYNLAAMYAEGQGVQQDFAQAMTWYRKAADQGEAKAQYNLALLYFTGQGAPQDLTEAYMWLDLAASQSGTGQELYVRARDALATKMSPEQIADGQQRAKVWQQTFERKTP